MPEDPIPFFKAEKVKAPNQRGNATDAFIGDKNPGYSDFKDLGFQPKTNADNFKLRAQDQSFGEQLFKTVGNLLPNIATGIVGGLGYTAELFDPSGDYDNALIRTMESWKNPFGEVYRENPNETFDLGDPAWWLNNIGGLVESAAEFAIPGGIEGKFLAGLAKGLSKTAKLGRIGDKIARGTAATATSAHLAFMEGAMSGKQIFKDVYKSQYKKNIEAGMDAEEADVQARDSASKSAALTVRTSAMMNTVMNMAALGPMFRNSENKVSQWIRNQGQRQDGELMSAYKARWTAAAEADPALKSALKYRSGLTSLPAAMLAEGTEEVNTQYAEERGKERGQLIAKSDLDVVSDYFDKVSNQEGALNFILGAFGGVAQTVLLDHLPLHSIEQRGVDGKPLLKDNPNIIQEPGSAPKYQMKRVSSKTKDALGRTQYFENAKDAVLKDIEWYSTKNAELAAATAKNDHLTANKLRNEIFGIHNLNAIMTGSAANWEGEYQTIAKMDNTKDLGEEMQPAIDDLQGQLEQVQATGGDASQITAQLEKMKAAQVKVSGKTAAMQAGYARDMDDNAYKEKALTAVQDLKWMQKRYDDLRADYIYDGEPHSEELVGHIFSREAGQKLTQRAIDEEEAQLMQDEDFMRTLDTYNNRTGLANKIAERLNADWENLHTAQQQNNLNELKRLAGKYGIVVNEDHELPKAIDGLTKKIQERVQKHKDAVKNTTDALYMDSGYDKWQEKNKGKTFQQYLEHLEEVNPVNARLMTRKAELEKAKEQWDIAAENLLTVKSAKGTRRFLDAAAKHQQEWKRAKETKHLQDKVAAFRRLADHETAANLSAQDKLIAAKQLHEELVENVKRTNSLKLILGDRQAELDELGINKNIRKHKAKVALRKEIQSINAEIGMLEVHRKMIQKQLELLQEQATTATAAATAAAAAPVATVTAPAVTATPPAAAPVVTPPVVTPPAAAAAASPVVTSPIITPPKISLEEEYEIEKKKIEQRNAGIEQQKQKVTTEYDTKISTIEEAAKGKDITLDEVLTPGNKFTAPNGTKYEIQDAGNGRVLVLADGATMTVVGRKSNGEIMGNVAGLEFLRYAAGKTDDKSVDTAKIKALEKERDEKLAELDSKKLSIPSPPAPSNPTVSDALKDVESTTKALEKFRWDDPKIERAVELAPNVYGDFKALAEDYHQFKKDGTNSEFVEAVEQALKEPAKATVSNPETIYQALQSSLPGEVVDAMDNIVMLQEARMETGVDYSYDLAKSGLQPLVNNQVISEATMHDIIIKQKEYLEHLAATAPGPVNTTPVAIPAAPVAPTITPADLDPVSESLTPVINQAVDFSDVKAEEISQHVGDKSNSSMKSNTATIEFMEIVRYTGQVLDKNGLPVNMTKMMFIPLYDRLDENANHNILKPNYINEGDVVEFVVDTEFKGMINFDKTNEMGEFGVPEKRDEAYTNHIDADGKIMMNEEGDGFANVPIKIILKRTGEVIGYLPRTDWVTAKHDNSNTYRNISDTIRHADGTISQGNVEAQKNRLMIARGNIVRAFNAGKGQTVTSTVEPRNSPGHTFYNMAVDRDKETSKLHPLLAKHLLPDEDIQFALINNGTVYTGHNIPFDKPANFDAKSLQKKYGKKGKAVNNIPVVLLPMPNGKFSESPLYTRQLKDRPADGQTIAWAIEAYLAHGTPEFNATHQKILDKIKEATRHDNARGLDITLEADLETFINQYFTFTNHFSEKHTNNTIGSGQKKAVPKFMLDIPVKIGNEVKSKIKIGTSYSGINPTYATLVNGKLDPTFMAELLDGLGNHYKNVVYTRGEIRGINHPGAFKSIIIPKNGTPQITEHKNYNEYLKTFAETIVYGKHRINKDGKEASVGDIRRGDARYVYGANPVINFDFGEVSNTQVIVDADQAVDTDNMTLEQLMGDMTFNALNPNSSTVIFAQDGTIENSNPATLSNLNTLQANTPAEKRNGKSPEQALSEMNDLGITDISPRFNPFLKC